MNVTISIHEHALHRKLHLNIHIALCTPSWDAVTLRGKVVLHSTQCRIIIYFNKMKGLGFICASVFPCPCMCRYMHAYKYVLLSCILV